MTEFDTLVAECIALKKGNREFALHYFDHDMSWSAGIGNTCIHVCLGESEAEIDANGDTPTAAVRALKERLIAIRAS